MAADIFAQQADAEVPVLSPRQRQPGHFTARDHPGRKGQVRIAAINCFLACPVEIGVIGVEVFRVGADFVAADRGGSMCLPMISDLVFTRQFQAKPVAVRNIDPDIGAVVVQLAVQGELVLVMHIVNIGLKPTLRRLVAVSRFRIDQFFRAGLLAGQVVHIVVAVGFAVGCAH